MRYDVVRGNGMTDQFLALVMWISIIVERNFQYFFVAKIGEINIVRSFQYPASGGMGNINVGSFHALLFLPTHMILYDVCLRNDGEE